MLRAINTRRFFETGAFPIKITLPCYSFVRKTCLNCKYKRETAEQDLIKNGPAPRSVYKNR